MKKQVGVLLALIGIMLSLPMSGHAEEEKTYYLEGMTVTAQKVEQNIQKIPGTVEALTDLELEERVINNFNEFVEYIPNVFLRKNSLDNALVIRGVSSFAGSLYSTAGFYVDGVNYPIHQMQDLDFWDIERIEVLKGPQGTLYGRNSESGVINIVTKKPTFDLSGKIYTQLGAYDAHDGEPIARGGFAINIPVIDNKFAMKFSGQRDYSSGWMENTYDDEHAQKINQLGGRFTTLITPTEDLEIITIVEQRKKDNGVGVYRYIEGPNKTKYNTLEWNGDNDNRVNAGAQVLKVNYDAGNFDIASVFSHHLFHQHYSNDADMSPADWGNSGGRNRIRILSEELRFSSAPGEDRLFDWLGGFYGYIEDVNTRYTAAGYTHNTKQDNSGAAAFGQTTWNITQKWHLTGGLRVDWLTLEGKKDLEGPGSLDHFSENHSYTELLPTASLAYDITDDILTYAKVSKGYLAGGYDYSTAKTEDQFYFKPEYSWNYELGLKTNLFEKSLIANVALFYIDIDDKQVAQMEPTTGDPERRRIVNAAKARSYGAELDLQWMPVAGLSVKGGLGYLNSRLKDWKTEGSDPFDYDNKVTPGSPEWSYTIGGTYRWECGMLVGADLVGVSSFYTDTKNQSKVDGRTLVNTRVGFEGEDLEVIFWVKNLFNKKYYENEWAWGPGSTLAQQGAPRSLGVSLTYNF